MSLELALKDHSVALTENTDTMKKLIAAWNLLTVNAKAAKDQEAEPLSAGGVPLNLDRAEKVTPPKPAVVQQEATALAVSTATTTATKSTAEVPKAAAVSQPTETVAAAPASSPEASNPAPSTVTYEEVRTLVLKVSKDKGRETAAAVLAGFGVAKAPELKPEQYADAVAQLQAALA